MRWLNEYQLIKTVYKKVSSDLRSVLRILKAIRLFLIKSLCKD